MRYPFQTFIATIFTFIFMGVVVASGELKIGKEATLLPKLNEITVKCSGNRSLLASLDQGNLAKICVKSCQIKANELLDMMKINPTQKEDSSCLKEIIIGYKCGNQAKTAYFYTGQEAEIICESEQK